MERDYRIVNRRAWDERAPAHAASPDYGLAHFDDPHYLSDELRFDRGRLGPVTGLRGVHLQCHIGTDTISLARLGARMSGLDFSPASLAEARKLAQRAGADVSFHEGDVYAAPELLGVGAFDLVYTGIGALCWLPDIRRWAGVVAALLAPGGRLFIREGHPVLWSLAEPSAEGALRIESAYFEQKDALILSSQGTYVQTDASFTHNVTHEWNHGLGEIVTALLDAGLTLTSLVEHDSAPWEALPGMMVKHDDGEWRLRERPERLPLTYTLSATKS
jgi:SAM-dependent methyltransferase